MTTPRFARLAPALAVLRLSFLIAAAAPILCQDETEPYFSISSQQTYGTADKPHISLAGYRVPAVQIRVYRINNGVKFFQEMENPHSFGPHPPRRPGKLTWIERIHNWKRGLRRDIRLTLRGQFTESPRAHLEKPAPPPALKETPQAAASYFAEAPVLNQDQLVLTFIQPVTSSRRWNAATVPVPVKEKGVYLVEAVHSDLRAYTVLVVSDIVLVVKTARTHVLAYVADRSTGEPVADVDVAAVGHHSNVLTTRTDGNGLASLNIEARAPAPDDVRLIAKHGTDYAIGDVASWMSSQARPWTGLIYTDRPVYRPGDTVHFRGILRITAPVGYEVPANKQVAVQISDPEGKPAYQKTLTTNTNGIIHDEMTTGRGATLGGYFINVKAGQNDMGGNFEIQEYKKPEYEILVTPDKPRVVEGESTPVTIDAKYYFGEPVSGAKVKYSVFRSRYWFPLWYDEDEEDYAQEDGGTYYPDAAGEQISSNQGTLDSDGKLRVDLPTTLSDHKLDYRYRIEAAVTDAAGREISGTGYVIATYGNFVLNLEPDRYFYQPGATATIKVQARDYDNKPVMTRVHLELAEWHFRDREKGEAKASTDVATSADGSATARLTMPAGGGSYRIIATAPGAFDRTIQTVTYLWSSAGELGGYYSGYGSLQIVPDKKIYHAGDKAQILLVSGQPNTPILVTIEGRDIRSEQVLRSHGATAIFEYTVTKDDEPGFFVNAAFIRKGTMYQGMKRIVAPPDDHKLTLRIATDKPQYLPGQTATYTIEAASCDGKPVSGADLSLGIVDEAIYAIRKDTTPDVVNFFYGREWNMVFTQNSLLYFFSGEAGKRRMRLAELRSPSVLAQLKPERLVQPKVRKVFPDTAFWAADLTTDAAGRAQAKVSFPDSLTTWRATVRGVAPADMFGSATQKTIVRKNLILRVAAPRFFVQGDEVVISGIVHNYLSTAKHARVTANFEGLALAGSNATQEIEIASRAEVKVDWRVKAQSVRHARITAEALTDEESDALELEYPVNPPGVPIRQASGGIIRNSGSASVTIDFPATAVTGSRSISIRVSPSVAGSIFSALDYLTSFPYGCVEQTMSSFLPDVVVTKAIRELGLKQPVNQDELSQKVQAGLERLYNFHHDDGGWGWWVSDESHPFMTAYVVAGLSEAKNDGIIVREDMIASGVSWIQKTLAQDETLQPDLRAYMEYALALAGRSEKPVMDASYGARSKLSPYGVALLGLAFELSKDARAGEMANALEASVQQSEVEAWWPAKRDEMLDFVTDVTPEASAYAMKLLTHERPNSPLLPKAELWLVNHRDEGYWWASTKQTAMVIYGLIDYVKVTKELQPNLTASIVINGQQLGAYAFTGSAIATTQEVNLEDAQLQPSLNRIQVSSSGSGTLFYSVSATHYSEQAREEKLGALSLNVLRDYFRLVPAKEGEQIIYDLKPLDGPLAQGDTIAVRLTVTGSDWRYLMVEDPIPAGTEFIEHDELYHFHEKPSWWQYWFTRREMHDDRMAIFQTRFREGQQQWFYLLKVVNPGIFHISPARVGPMYQPRILATTESKTMEVQ